MALTDGDKMAAAALTVGLMPDMAHDEAGVRKATKAYFEFLDAIEAENNKRQVEKDNAEKASKRQQEMTARYVIPAETPPPGDRD